MDEQSGAERRVHPRTNTSMVATMEHEGDTVEGMVENIGQGGVFFATEILEMLVDEGAPVTLRFTCRRDGVEEENRVPGTVLRTERYFDGTRVVRAFAVKFDDQLDLAGVEL